MDRAVSIFNSLSTVEVFKHVQTKDAIELTDEQLQCLQKKLTSILEDVDAFCKENKIRYFLGGGTALGAVRNQGFIPWDDDIDINMPRKDYERFIRLFPQKMGTKYWLHTPEYTKNYGLLLARVRAKNTCVKTREDFFNLDECGAFIDIFVLENTPNNKIFRIVHGIGSMGLGFLLSCRKFYKEYKFLKPLMEDNKEIKNIFKVKAAIGFLISFLPLHVWVHINNSWNKCCSKQKTGYFVTIPAGRKHYWGEMLPSNELESSTTYLFEGKQYPCFQSDLYLRQLYGDYMCIPEEADREKHIFYKFKL